VINVWGYRRDRYHLQGELSVSWMECEADKIRETARVIGVTPERLVHDTVDEVLKEARFIPAADRLKQSWGKDR